MASANKGKIRTWRGTLKTARLGRSLAAVTLCIVAALSGCRKPSLRRPSAPQLRGPVKDLVAIRAGDEILLGWTVPRRGTTKLLVNGSIKVQVCRRESIAGECIDAGAPLHLARGAKGSFSEWLPATLASGTPRLLYYSVELLDRDGRSTGLSNSVITLAGAPPPAVVGLTVEMTAKGALIRWKPDGTLNGAGEGKVRLRRTEIIQTPATEAMREGLAPLPPIPPEIDLFAQDGTGQELDTNIRAGKTYAYTVQRVIQLKVNGQMLELDGQLSPQVQIDTATGIHN